MLLTLHSSNKYKYINIIDEYGDKIFFKNTFSFYVRKY